MASSGNPTNDDQPSTNNNHNIPAIFTPQPQSYTPGHQQPLVWTGPIADPDESPESSDQDSALGSYASTHSTSMTDGAYAYKEEHGRRYHAEKTGAQYHRKLD
jgi:hypothetical protein